MDMSLPKVSVIIPVYNAGKYLSECLSSVISQTLREIEIVCIDDGSSDDSMEVAKQFAESDGRFRLLGSSTENHGQAYARNIGIEQAHGEFISFVDADDMLASPDALQILYETAMTDHLEGVIFDSTGFYETAGARQLFVGDVVQFCVQSGIVHTGQELFKQAVMAEGYTNVIWQQFWKREFLEKEQLRFVVDTSPWEDMLFSFQAFLLCKRMKHIQKVFYTYRYQENSSSMGLYTLRKLYSHFRCYFEALKFLERCPIAGDISLPCTRFLNNIKNILKEQSVKLTEVGADIQSISFDTIIEKVYFQMLLTEEYTYITVPLQLDQYEMIKAAKKIIIYGAGTAGRDVAKLLYRYGFFEFIFAVTKQDGKQKSLCNVPIKEISDLVAERESSVVLLAVTQIYRNEMKENLEKLGFTKVVVIE